MVKHGAILAVVASSSLLGRVDVLGLWLHPLLVIAYLRNVGVLLVVVGVCYGHEKFMHLRV